LLCVVCFLCGYLLESKSAPCLRRQKMEMIDHVSGLICSLDTRTLILRDQFLLFRFITFLCRTAFPFIFFCALARAAQTFFMASSHSLKCFSFLSSDTLYVSRSCMIVSCTSLSSLFSQVMFPSRPCDFDTSRVFATNFCLSLFFSWYNSAIVSYTYFICCEDS
jgi:hypothetical protein